MINTVKKFSVQIQWGSESTRKENPDAVFTYEFDTQKELDAFLKGVDESSGWSEYTIVGEDD